MACQEASLLERQSSDTNGIGSGVLLVINLDNHMVRNDIPQIAIYKI